MTRTSSSQPDWAQGLGATGYGIFVGLVRAYFEERGIVIVFDVDSGVIRTDLSERATQSAFGLLNLAQVCRQADRDAWRDVVRAHFDTVFAVSDGDSVLRVDVHHFESCRDMLRARLYPLDITRQSDELVSRPGPPGTLEVLVLDLPTSVRTVSRHEADAWPANDETLFEVARANLIAAGALPVTAVEIERGVQLKVIMGDPYYAASHALFLDRYLACDLPHGALVAIPKRDVVLLHEIRTIAAVEAVTALLRITVGMHRDGPGSLSQAVYWAHDDVFDELPYRIEGETLRFTPPDAFLAVLESLTRGAQWS
ncbi:MAG: hypothetical protein ABIQ99_14670 [Thermoflexales bacterium]